MIAHIVFWGWPFFCAVAFQRFGLAAAVASAVIGGYLMLPAHIIVDLPMIPPIDRDMIAIGSAFFCAILITSRMSQKGVQPEQVAPLGVRPGLLPQSKTVQLLMAMLVLGAAMTALTNRDPVFDGGKALEGLTVYDAFSLALGAAVTLLPLILARKYFAYEAGQRTLLMVLCIAGLIYSVPTLYEVRMSPQLHLRIYGIDVMSWIQNVRGGGFRPTVFLKHGLILGIFMSVAVLSAAACIRVARVEQKPLFILAFIWLYLTLFLVKAFGAFMIATFFVPFLLLLNARLQLLIAACFAGVVLTYPMLRGAGLAPTTFFINAAASIDPERGRSLDFRVNNEDFLLLKAEKRPLFGWGWKGRSRVYENGRDISTTDGYWIIILGLGGWVKYIADFGLLTCAVLILAFRRKDYEVSIATSALCLILVANLIDLIPNTGISIVTWTITGALIGRLEVRRGEQELDEDEAKLEAAGQRRYPYARARPKPGPQRASIKVRNHEV